MIEMEKLKKLGIIKFLNDEKWDYDYTTINGIDYFNWEDEEPLNDITALINDILPAYGDMEDIQEWLRSLPDKYHNL
jgi:hypothetical protein